jgi:hypothetical protein
MADTRSVAASCGFVLTAEGRQALREAPTCACRVQFDGGLLVCPDCDTVYGLAREMLSSSFPTPPVRKGN